MTETHSTHMLVKAEESTMPGSHTKHGLPETCIENGEPVCKKTCPTPATQSSLATKSRDPMTRKCLRHQSPKLPCVQLAVQPDVHQPEALTPQKHQNHHQRMNMLHQALSGIPQTRTTPVQIETMMLLTYRFMPRMSPLMMTVILPLPQSRSQS